MPDRSSPPAPLFEVPLARVHQVMGRKPSLWWGHVAFTAEEVLESWRTGLIETDSYSLARSPWPRDRHLQRVAFFCAQGWQSPPRVKPTEQGLSFMEGQHRYLAALALNHRIITLAVEGEAQHIEHWLGRLNIAIDPFYPMPMALGVRCLPLPNHFR